MNTYNKEKRIQAYINFFANFEIEVIVISEQPSQATDTVPNVNAAHDDNFESDAFKDFTNFLYQ
jgi:hypothetical protein